MKHFNSLFVIILTILLIAGCEHFETPVDVEKTHTPGRLQKALNQQDLIPGQYVIILSDDIVRVPDVASEMAKTHAATLEFVYQKAIKGFSIHMSAQAASRLAGDARVKYIEQDRWVSVGRPEGKGKPPKPPKGQVTPWGITRVGGPRDGTGETAWIIDTGIDLDHTDLNVDVDRSKNFVPRGKKSPNDGNGHGTHVAGTVAAIDNEQDVVGVAAGATVVAVRVLGNDGSGAYSWVIAGVDYVAANASAGDVANMSLTGPPYLALDEAVEGAASLGIIFSLAAGNDGDNATNYSPARLDHINVYTISAINDQDTMPWWSNYGPPVDYAAPGVNILSTKNGGGTTIKNGTSMSAPHVAGLLLLGSLNTDGTAIDDPYPPPDPIAHY